MIRVRFRRWCDFFCFDISCLTDNCAAILNWTQFYRIHYSFKLWAERQCANKHTRHWWETNERNTLNRHSLESCCCFSCHEVTIEEVYRMCWQEISHRFSDNILTILACWLSARNTAKILIFHTYYLRIYNMMSHLRRHAHFLLPNPIFIDAQTNSRHFHVVNQLRYIWHHIDKLIQSMKISKQSSALYGLCWSVLSR